MTGSQRNTAYSAIARLKSGSRRKGGLTATATGRLEGWRILLLALPLLLALQLTIPAHAANDRPNILLIYVDDLGFGDLGSYGHPVIKTPNLDALAESGLRFTNYYAPSALCSPSRAGLLTGRYPYRTGIKSWIPANSNVFLRDEEITLAEVLKTRGYRTALIGKWHLNSDLGSINEPQPNDQGFDYFYGHNAYQIPTSRNPTNLFRNRKALATQNGFIADLYATEALNWLKQPADNPFFLYLSLAEPHTTFENPAEYNARYSEYTRGTIKPIPSGLKQPPKETLIARGPGEYYANITYMDAQIGRVLDWLEENEAADNTIVVFASDNGPVTSDWIQWFEVNAHGSTGGLRGRKHYLYEGGIKVPAIVRFPGTTKAGTTSATPVAGTDLFTTLAKAAGAQLPEDRPIDGVDLRKHLRRPQKQSRPLSSRTLFWALDSVGPFEFAIQQRRWKLLLDSKHQPGALYDLQTDPLELFDLRAEQPARTQRLLKEFHRQLDSVMTDPLRPQIGPPFSSG